jgi:hypothetical protein
MIGMRSVASVAAAVIGLAMVVGPRAPDPAIGIAAERLVRAQAEDATEALDAVRAAVEPGLDQARRAAAAVLTADDPPGARLVAAGDAIAAADDAAAAARSAVADLNGARSAWRGDATPLPQPLAAGELASIGAQLGGTASAADTFVDLRRRGSALPEVLEDALAALDRGDLVGAGELVEEARADHDLVAGWDAGPITLPVWLETMDAMISAVEQIVEATRAGDAAAAGAAADAFAALADDAAVADRALRIAFGEAGSALTAAPLERLAAALRGIEAVRTTTAAIAAGVER